MTLVNTFKVRSLVFAAAFLLAFATAEAQVGPGTKGTIAKFSSPTSVGDSVIVEDKFGKVGVGTSTPTSKFTVAGTIESTTGGFKFPDGTVQTSAMKDPALSAFQKDLHIDGDATSGSFAVPGNKRLVIEYLSIRATAENGTRFLSFDLRTTLNGDHVSHSVIPAYSGSGVSHDLFILQNKVRIYADTDAGGEVRVGFNRGQNNSGIADITISGYMLDLPQAAKEVNDANKLAAVRIPKGISLKKRR
jgi:hypothetical protein